MTDEQIKQNAEAYAIKICEEIPIDYRVVSVAYFAGAHSRDEEIKQLCNPWRDAKTELPKEKCKVYVLKNGVPDFAIYTGRKKNKTFVTAYLVRHLVGTYLDVCNKDLRRNTN